ncbi:MAG: SHOCT domain-containing protein [Pseudonocardiaceae bacterium]
MTWEYLAMAYGPGDGPPWRDGGGWDGPPVWFGIVGGILWLLFWAAVIVVGIVLLRRYMRSRPKVGDSAVAALGERYARGEINEDDYRQRLSVLREQQT